MQPNRILISVIVLMCIGHATAGAVTRKAGDSVRVTEETTIQEDLAVAGESVHIAGTIMGDLLAAGSTVNTSAKVSQSAMLAGMNLRLTGSVANDLYAAGSDVNVTQTIADNAWIAGGTVSVNEGTVIGGDLLAAGGTVTIDGIVHSNVYAAGGKININGTVDGNVKLEGGDISIGPNAAIRGDLIYKSPQKADIADGAIISGATKFTLREEKEEVEPISPVTRYLFWLYCLTALYIAGVVLIALAPTQMASVSDRLRAVPWWSLLTGFLILVAAPVALLVVTLTFVGIPLALIFWAIYFISIYISRLFVALAIGRLIFRRAPGARSYQYLDLLVGLVLLWILFAIPIIGWLIQPIAIFFGLGAFYIQCYHQIRKTYSEGSTQTGGTL